LDETAQFSLREFNDLPGDSARQVLLNCCPARRWADELVSARPYACADELLARSAQAVTGLEPDDLRQALSGHPRIGAPEPAGQAHRAAGGWSGQEQSGVDRADQELMQALAAGNRAYEQRFGHIYLVCATGRSGAELLDLLQARLGHDPAAEWRVVAAELEKINRIRLRKLIEG